MSGAPTKSTQSIAGRWRCGRPRNGDETMEFPNLDPVAFSVGPLQIRWYGLAYFAGILAGIRLAEHMVKRFTDLGLERGVFSEFMSSAFIGVIAGGRLGSIILYNPHHYLAHPLDVFAIWKGGMAFHGGLIGLVIAAFLHCRRHNINLLAFGDVAACAAPIGLFLGRIANFINGELWGRSTNLPWAVVFPNPAAGGIPRHPSQLYEALAEGALLFVVTNAMARVGSVRRRHGVIAGVFLFGYAVARILIELTREPDAPLIGPLTRGQAYSMPMLLVGATMIALALLHRANVRAR